MSGILFYEDRSAQPGRNFEISSDAARKLLGTIYLPKGVFKSGGKGTIADASAYTIIANRLDLGGANLVINAIAEPAMSPLQQGLGRTTRQLVWRISPRTRHACGPNAENK